VSKEAAALRPLLERFGVPRDGALIVHSAISKLSRRGYRAEAMIDCIIEHVRDGHVFMPTMTWRTVTPEDPFWDEMETPSQTGVLSEIFRQRYAGARSIHPTHSVAGIGPAAVPLLSRHHIDDTPVSNNSPYGLLRDYPTCILVLGVGLETVTAIHLAEEMINPELYIRPPASRELYQCRDRHGVVHQVWTRRHWRLDRDFNQFAPALMERGEMRSGHIEDCPYALVSLRDLLRYVFAVLMENPRATLRRTIQADNRMGDLHPGRG